MLRQNTVTSEVSSICFDCFSVTRTAAIRQILRAEPFESEQVLQQCSDLCRQAAQALTLQRPLSLDFIHRCAEACATCADYCAARDMDACAIICWEAAAALGDDIARIDQPMLLAAE